MGRAGFLLLASMLSGPAWADDIGGLRTMDLGVQGRLSEHCAIGAIENHSFGDLTQPAAEFATRVPLVCNLPVNVTIRSAHGGLANTEHPRGEGPYAGNLPYRMNVVLPVRTPTQSVLSEDFQSVDLLAGRTISTNGGIAVDGMTLYIALDRPTSAAGLLGGDYSEVIEITVTPG